MSVEQQVDALAISVENLKSAVVSKKATLDASVVDAQSATAQAQIAKANTLSARDQAGAFKDAAYTAAQSAASAVAYQDLTALAAEMAVTAVDVFIYDTSKDSDGGAWRHRCAGTSWFNEPLNTATRGARREFPAVAVIVAEADKVTIYDADDPALPMWMVFQSGSGALPSIWRGWRPAEAASMLNGILCIGLSGSDGGYTGLYFAEFLADEVYRRNPLGTYGAGLTVARRNDQSALVSVISAAAIANGTVNDIAMTVLPDAPIDPATGLPVPAIAVATAGGLSVIKDDGTVVDLLTGVGTINKASFTDEQGLVAAGGGGVAFRVWKFNTLPSGDSNAFDVILHAGTSPSIGAPGNLIGQNSNLYRENTWFIDQQVGKKGLIAVFESRDDVSKSLVNLVMPNYNTGWMPGDIKGAFLADTEATALVGGELVTNGAFDADLNGWVDFSQVGGAIEWNPAGALDIISATANGDVYQAVAVIVGHRYRVSFDNVGAANIHFFVGTSIGGAQLVGVTTVNGGAKGEREFVATAATVYLTFSERTAGETSTIDNVSIHRADADRSVANRGLLVNGTITRSPVATGAELVAYSGFSASNYLEQPYNSGLNFGTGDFCVMGWGKTNINGTFLSRGDGVSAGSWYWRHLSGSSSPFYIHDGSAFRLALNAPLPQAEMVHFALLRRSGTLFLYGNGELMGSLSGAYPALSMTNLTAKLRIGDQQHSSYSGAGEKQALLRISATAPTADQIRRIYEDEKALFQENAACTLYGASDTVTALAHDPDTGLLHVGTSAGRSVFKGLRLVANTTVPVGAAIAAVGGMVVEE